MFHVDSPFKSSIYPWILWNKPSSYCWHRLQPFLQTWDWQTNPWGLHSLRLVVLLFLEALDNEASPKSTDPQSVSLLGQSLGGIQHTSIYINNMYHIMWHPHNIPPQYLPISSQSAVPLNEILGAEPILRAAAWHGHGSFCQQCGEIVGIWWRMECQWGYSGDTMMDNNGRIMEC